MRRSSIFLLLTLALSVGAAPANEVFRYTPRSDDDDLGDGFPFLTKDSFKLGHTDKTKLICDSPQTDARGDDTGKTRREVWKKAEMDKFTPHLNNFIAGGEAPFSEFKWSLPKTLGDLTTIFNGWTCDSDDCTEPLFNSVGQCEESEVGAQFWMLMHSLYHFQVFMKAFKEHIQYQGGLIADKVGALMNKLHPIELSADNAGWSIFISSIMAGAAGFLFMNPATAAAAGIAAAAFGFATGAITQIGNQNDQNIVNQFYDVTDAVNVTRSTFDLLAQEIGKMSIEILDDVPKNRGDKSYTDYQTNAVTLLKGGSFADKVSPNVTASMSSELHEAAVLGIVTMYWGKLVIGKLTKEILGTKPCDLKGDNVQFPKEFWRLCVGDTAYFFANADPNSGLVDKAFNDLPEEFEDFWNGDDDGLYAGFRPIDLVNYSSNSEKTAGWGMLWDASEALMWTLLDHAKNPDKGRLTPFNYPILELDLADADPPNALRNKKEDAGEISWSSTHAIDHQRLRFMMYQAMREQKDSHGNSYPYDTTKNVKWSMYPYYWDGKKRSE